jgi:VanZ family protein
MFSFRWFRIFCWVTVVAWAGTIFWLSTKTGTEVERINFMGIWDKAGHFIAFSTGGAVVAAALRFSTCWSCWRIGMVTTVLVSAYGWSDEWHQQFTPGRSAKDIGDWTADTLGGAAGALAIAFIYVKRNRSHRPTSPAA